MKRTEESIKMRIWRRSQRLRETILASFWEPAPMLRTRLAEFSLRDWRSTLYWLDVSGLALYFLDRINQLGLEGCLPSIILDRLRDNLRENSERAISLFGDAASLSLKFKRRKIKFALLKGI